MKARFTFYLLVVLLPGEFLAHGEVQEFTIQYTEVGLQIERQEGWLPWNRVPTRS